MLRHKLLLILFSTTALMMVLAVAALWALQSVFVDLDDLHTREGLAVGRINTMGAALSDAEVELYRLRSGGPTHLPGLDTAMTKLRQSGQELISPTLMDDPALRDAQSALEGQINNMDSLLDAILTPTEPAQASAASLQALEQAARMREQLLTINSHLHAHVQVEQADLTARFRNMVIAMAVGFLIVINGSILLMLRAAGMVLRPVDRLVQASRELAKENFDHRVTVGQHDEFDELATAYNHLAEQLQEKEHQRMQTLHQTALTLNHELNNAITTIEMQLTLLRRRSGPDVALEQNLGRIHENLHRMAEVIGSLKQLRRVVLTDYVDGVKMLDLRESIRDDRPRIASG